jgi:hypothetical protein
MILGMKQRDLEEIENEMENLNINQVHLYKVVCMCTHVKRRRGTIISLHYGLWHLGKNVKWRKEKNAS